MPELSEQFARFGRFGVVGASGTLINLGLFAAMTNALHVHYLVAGPLAFELSFLSNYTFNNVWTFADRRSPLLSSTLLRCQFVSGVALLISFATLYFSVSTFAMPTLLGNLAGVVLATVWNFGLSLRWTWRAPAPQTRAMRQNSQAPLAA